MREVKRMQRNRQNHVQHIEQVENNCKRANKNPKGRTPGGHAERNSARAGVQKGAKRIAWKKESEQADHLRLNYTNKTPTKQENPKRVVDERGPVQKGRRKPSAKNPYAGKYCQNGKTTPEREKTVGGQVPATETKRNSKQQ